MSNTLVAIGSSTVRDYSFLLPLSCLFWRDLIGHQPRAFLVGSEDEWLSANKTRTVVEALRQHKIEHVFVERIAGYEDATIAQNVRQHAAADPSIADNTWVMMSDADLWPLRKDTYWLHDNRSEKAISYYCNGDCFISKEDVLAKYDARLPFQSLPTCHIVMRAREWRAIYSLSLDGDVVGNTKRTLDTHWNTFVNNFAGSDRGLAVWCTDQWLVTEKMCRQEWFPSDVLFIARRGQPPINRLDRGHLGDWRLDGFDMKRWVDAHIHKAPESDNHWNTILPIINALLPQHITWAMEYRDRYCR